ncbi:MAG: tripartite tricarboxylate transporter TctB family protein [Pseudomonadota bacterium]
MEENQDPQDSGRPAVTTHTMEIVVALLFLLFGGVVAFDSYRLGARWAEEGPQSGYFPFYIGLIICISSIVTLLQALFGGAAGGSNTFVERGQLKLMLSVLVPAALYVLGIQVIGIYVASAVYIAVFMAWLGRYSWFKGAALGLAASVSFFVMFEIWFKVPLFKGMFNPLGFLGY